METQTHDGRTPCDNRSKIEVRQLQAKECQGLPENFQKVEVARNDSSLQVTEGAQHFFLQYRNYLFGAKVARRKRKVNDGSSGPLSIRSVEKHMQVKCFWATRPFLSPGAAFTQTERGAATPSTLANMILNRRLQGYPQASSCRSQARH